MRQVTINAEQELFVIPEGKGYSCLGFEVCYKQSIALATELGVTIPMKSRMATIDAYTYYRQLCDIAKDKNARTGWRSKSELIPELIGLEGKRVEIVNQWGEKERFYVGRSTGYIPCHLAIKQRNSSGGGAVLGPIQSVRVLYSR